MGIFPCLSNHLDVLLDLLSNFEKNGFIARKGVPFNITTISIEIALFSFPKIQPIKSYCIRIFNKSSGKYTMFQTTYKGFFPLRGSHLYFASDSVVKCMKIVVKLPIEITTLGKSPI
jgi:hypothetical protein